MVLPLYLAMTAQDLTGTASIPRRLGVYASPDARVPPGTMLILDDRGPHPYDPAWIASMVHALGIESVLLDFEREPDGTSVRNAQALLEALPCPLAAPPGFLEDPACPVFLPPCPLHVPLAEYLHPWQGREVWLDVTLRQQTVSVTPDGTRYGTPVPADRQGGVFDEVLMCRCMTEIAADEVRFTLLDTPDTFRMKLQEAARLGVTRAVGLYQELKFKL